MTALDDAVAVFHDSLTGLLGAAQAAVAGPPRLVPTAGGVVERADTLLDAGRAVQTAIDAAVTDPVEATTRMAALLDAHLRAAQMCAATDAHADPDAPNVPADLARYLPAQSSAPAPPAPPAATESMASMAEIVLADAGDGIADTLLRLSGRDPLRGGAATTLPEPVSDCVTTIRTSTVRSVTNLAEAVVTGGVLGGLAPALAALPALRPLVDYVDGALGVLKRAVVKLLGRASELILSILGSAGLAGVQKWLSDVLRAVGDRWAGRAFDELFDVSGLQARLGALTADLSADVVSADAARVENSFQDWARWGVRGVHVLGVAAGWLATLNPLVPLIPGLLILGYLLWIANDHLDWPAWPLPSACPGLITVLTAG